MRTSSWLPGPPGGGPTWTLRRPSPWCTESSLRGSRRKGRTTHDSRGSAILDHAGPGLPISTCRIAGWEGKGKVALALARNTDMPAPETARHTAPENLFCN